MVIKPYNFHSFQCLMSSRLSISAEEIFLDIPAAEPWFEQWRETFLSVQPPSDHEFTRHFLSCLIVLSSTDPNPLETANALTRKVQTMQNVTPPKLPKWFSTDTLNCYVLLHDRSHSDLNKWVCAIYFPAVENRNKLNWRFSSAQQAFETLKLAFGDSKCFLLQINSHQSPAPNDSIDPWLKFLRRQTKNVNWFQRAFQTSTEFLNRFFRLGFSVGSWQCAKDATRCEQCNIDAFHRYNVFVGNTTFWYYYQRRSRRSSAKSFPRAGNWGNRTLLSKSILAELRQN